jgi:hypothetical protein
VIKNIFLILRKPVDAAFLIATAPAALVLLAYRRLGSQNLPWTTNLLKKIGLFPIRNHYYEPLFDHSQLRDPLSDDRNLPGINLNVEGQVDLLRRLTYTSELIQLRLNEKSLNRLPSYLENGSFGAGDAEFLYQFLRATKPHRVIEIGSGYSTRIANMALQRNLLESGIESTHTCIEPYEMKWLESLVGTDVIRKRVENCDLDWSKELGPGDLLFVDSSHIIRPQGDVLKEYLEILPQLASGVYVHVHDIFTPKDYPHGWIVERVRFWNEQYLLEAILSKSNRYEVVGALNYLKHHHFEELKNVCPYLTLDREPGSIYIKVC